MLISVRGNKVHEIFVNTPIGYDHEVVIPVTKIEFSDSLSVKYYVMFQKGFAGSGLSDKIYYQVLESGKQTLLKQIAVTYRDSIPYGPAIITRNFEQKPVYFILKKSGVYKAGKNGGNVQDILADRRKELDSYITAHELRLKYETDLVSVIRYYNSLFTE